MRPSQKVIELVTRCDLLRLALLDERVSGKILFPTSDALAVAFPQPEITQKRNRGSAPMPIATVF
jgi:hypothetical protein